MGKLSVLVLYTVLEKNYSLSVVIGLLQLSPLLLLFWTIALVQPILHCLPLEILSYKADEFSQNALVKKTTSSSS